MFNITRNISHETIYDNTKILIKQYENNENNENNENCTICLEQINNNDIIREINKCKHYFHINCADRWFKDNIKCPYCRQDIRQ